MASLSAISLSYGNSSVTVGTVFSRMDNFVAASINSSSLMPVIPNLSGAITLPDCISNIDSRSTSSVSGIGQTTLSLL